MSGHTPHAEYLAKDKLTAEQLARVVVLFRQSDSLSLWGIPYRMRPGQSPRDILRGPLGKYGPPADWVYLGSPGWWGDLTARDRALVEALLAGADDVPTGPYEWCYLNVEGK
jgi:hypothetical protein